MIMKLAQWLKPIFIVSVVFLFAPGKAQSLSNEQLVNALKSGGYVIVMRHASSPRELPDSTEARPGNTNRERQLDAAGQRDATAMGNALRRLRIPIAQVESSPTYRTLETANFAGFSEVVLRDALGNQGMVNSSEISRAWLRERVTNAPSQGNRLIITHQPNIIGAFTELEAVAEGEALVFAPDTGNATPIGRIRISQWPRL